VSDSYKHIKLPGPNKRSPYTSEKGGNSKINSPPRDRIKHGQKILKLFKKAWHESQNEFLVAYPERNGIYLEFISSPGFELAIKSLEDLKQGIRLCNVRKEENTKKEGGGTISYATVYIPKNKHNVFFQKIERYLEETTSQGNPKNKQLINSINELRKALLIDSFWTDDKDLIPDDTLIWCEVWLRDTNNATDKFKNLLSKLQINSTSDSIKFPERIVKLIQVNKEKLQNLTLGSDDIAEYRKAKDTADFILSLKPFEQQEWANDLLDRLSIDNNSQVSVCVLDTGINRGHPLIEPVIPDDNCMTVNNEWGTNDHDGHGTLMAGVAAYNNLQELLENQETITLYHKLESVKILPPRGQNKKELWGDITSRAISIAEINKPNNKRIICSAVTAIDTRDRGRPSSWSGAIDNITSGFSDEGKKLIILATGNITDFNQIYNYPDNQITDSIHDPGQAWNALTIGAYTRLTEITSQDLNGYSALAKENQLSPFSTCSRLWENKWPIKPEVVFEGGNIAIDNSKFCSEANELSLISTFHRPQERLFKPFNMTSAATAQAAYFAARIQTVYPDYWPETIRGLIVHSAKWPDELRNQFAQKDTKREIYNLLRVCGYGVPDLKKALYCANNSLTLIAESEIQPFIKDNKASIKTNEMHLYRLPWPAEALKELGKTEVRMRVTLSYFIEPGPGEIGWQDRYRYPSHGLRFALNSPTESEDEFVKRINKAARDNDEEKPDTNSPSSHWVIGQKRNKGSIHSDIWKGTAADLASSNLIAIYPSIGWWKERKYLGKVNNKSRYSLIVSIETQKQNIDIYTPVTIQISQQIKV